MTAIRGLCKKTILLENGSIKEIGETDGVITNYLKGSSQEVYEVVNQSNYIKSFTINDEDNNPFKNNLVPIGANVNFCIEFKDDLPKDLDYCFIGVEDFNQQRVFSLGTHLDIDYKPIKFIGSQSIICKIQN